MWFDDETYLEPGLGIRSVGPEYQRVVGIQHRTVDHVLLGPLVLHVVAKSPGKLDLCVIVDVAANEKLATLMVQGVSTDK